MLLVVLIVLLFFVMLAAIAAVSAVVAVRHLRRPVELFPGAQTGAPLRWRWSLSRSALLHKRLIVALASVRLAAATSGPLGPVRSGLAGGGGRSGRSARSGQPEQSAGSVPWQDLVSEAEALAVDVDRRLVMADAQPRAVRTRAVASLEPEVAQVEQACGRLADTVRTWAAAAPGRTAADLLDRIGAIDAALGEVRAIEEDAVPALPPPAASEITINPPARSRVRRTN